MNTMLLPTPAPRTASLGRAAAIELAIVPRAGRLPADLVDGTLDALAPMQHSFRHFGSLNVRMIDHIADMISETLATGGQR
jgi:hypothetical protein